MAYSITPSRASAPYVARLDALLGGNWVSFSAKARKLRVGSTTFAGLTDDDIDDLRDPYRDFDTARRIVHEARGLY